MKDIHLADGFRISDLTQVELGGLRGRMLMWRE
jgi:hypothetical protein